MRQIEVMKWNEGTGQAEKEMSTLDLITGLLNMKKPEEMPRGLEKFKMFGRLNEAFQKSEETGTLSLEESEYSFVMGLVNNDMPAVWGLSPNIKKAVEAIVDAEKT
jgi:hypothetical protein